VSYDVTIGDFERNYTSNVSCMWRHAGLNLREFDERPAAELIEPLRGAIHKMIDDPNTYEAMEPANGWGDYKGCLDFLISILHACREEPASKVEVFS
jgi:hypothetical protein